jgi:tetratricopeptide (TPR) repeat protein
VRSEHPLRPPPDRLEISETLDAYGPRTAPSTGEEGLAGGLAVPTASRAGALGPASRSIRREQARAPIQGRIDKAKALAKGGKLEEAIALLRAVIADEARPAAERARAALVASELAFAGDRTTTRSELFLLRATALDPRVSGAARVHAKLLWQQGQTREALTKIEEALAADPNNIDLLRSRARLLIVNSRPAAALPVVERAMRLARTRGLKGKALAELERSYAWVLYENKKPADAVAVAKRVTANPDASLNQRSSAHTLLAELCAPPSFNAGATSQDDRTDLGPAQKAAAKKLFEDAQTAYQAADYAEVRRLAEEIFKIKPDDAMAHRMWAIAGRAEQVAGRALIPPLDTAAERTAVVKKLEALAATARVGVPPRPGRPEDLFPEWNRLTPVQQATVAYSILGYGDLIPKVIESGAKYRLAHVGESATFYDPAVESNGPSDSFGRYPYAGRGWWNPTNDVIVTGLEKIDGAARGGYDTITHEFAHLVHGMLKKAKQRVTAGTPRAGDNALAADFDRIATLYDEALNRRNGQDMLEAYSRKNQWEYFAQAMMSYLSPDPTGQNEESSRRLFQLNPNMWRFVRNFANQHRDFPATLADGTAYDHGTNHPAVGTAAMGTALNLDRLRRTSGRGEIQGTSRASLRHLRAIYNPGQPPKAPPTPKPSVTQLPRLTPGVELQNRDAAALAELARGGNFDAAVEKARYIQRQLEANAYRPEETRELVTAFGEALHQAEAKAKWKIWEILLGIFTAGLGAIVIHLSKSDARDLRGRVKEMMAKRTPEQRHAEMWHRAGQRYAKAGGQALANYRAVHGDPALRTELAAGVKANNPGWSDAQVEAAVDRLMAGIDDADRARVSAAPHPHPSYGGLSKQQRDAEAALVLERGGGIGAAEANVEPPNYLAKPEPMIGQMSFDQLQAHAAAEIEAVNRLLARPNLAGALKTRLEAARARLVELGREINDARAAFVGPQRTRSAGQMPAELGRLRGVPKPVPTSPIATAGLLAVHEEIEVVRAALP